MVGVEFKSYAITAAAPRRKAKGDSAHSFHAKRYQSFLPAGVPSPDDGEDIFALVIWFPLSMEFPGHAPTHALSLLVEMGPVGQRLAHVEGLVRGLVLPCG